jgi:polysaccharide export outer membrane protein
MKNSSRSTANLTGKLFRLFTTNWLQGGAGLCLAGWMLSGCVSEQPKFADVTYLTAPVADSNAAPATSTAVTNGLAASSSATNAAAAGDTNSMAALDDKRELAIGDQVSFRIIEDNQNPKLLPVTASGDVEVPHLGPFPAAGKTCKKLAGELKAALEKQYYFRATVIISVDSMTRSAGRVYAYGAVRTQGPQEIPGDEDFTLSKAILRAGGFTDFADTHKVKVTRKSASGGTNQTFTVDVGKVLEKGRTDLDLPLEAGDTFYVKERVFRF